MLWIYYRYFGLVFINIKLFLCFLSHFISLERASRSAELSGKTFYLRRIPSRYLECLFSSKRSLSIKRVSAANVGLHVPKAAIVSTVAAHLPSSLPVNLQVFIPSINTVQVTRVPPHSGSLCFRNSFTATDESSHQQILTILRQQSFGKCHVLQQEGLLKGLSLEESAPCLGMVCFL